jgi:hypothetical protein
VQEAVEQLAVARRHLAGTRSAGRTLLGQSLQLVINASVADSLAAAAQRQVELLQQQLQAVVLLEVGAALSGVCGAAWPCGDVHGPP